MTDAHDEDAGITREQYTEALAELRAQRGIVQEKRDETSTAATDTVPGLRPVDWASASSRLYEDRLDAVSLELFRVRDVLDAALAAIDRSMGVVVERRPAIRHVTAYEGSRR